MTIKVSLDTSVTPPKVTVNPEQHHVNNGNQTINWVPDANQSFTFESLTIADPPFGTPTVTPAEITVADDNQTPGVYPYTICVSFNGSTYCSAANSITDGGGEPSIKNN